MLSPQSGRHLPESCGDEFFGFPNEINKTSFFIPHHFRPLTLIPVPPSDTPDDAMSGGAGAGEEHCRRCKIPEDGSGPEHLLTESIVPSVKQ